jgi:hypothetical protein
MWNQIRRWWKAEGDLVGLQNVSDRMLDDMGLEREGLRDRVLGREGPATSTEPEPRRKALGSDLRVASQC